MKEFNNADERAHKFFNRGGYNTNIHWNSLHEDLKPTPTIGNRDEFCLYCGKTTLPIQGKSVRLTGYCTSYYDKGQCCVCKDAMDFLEISAEIKKIKDETYKRIKGLECNMPIYNQEVINACIQRMADDAKRSSSKFSLKRSLKELNIKINDCRENNDD